MSNVGKVLLIEDDPGIVVSLRRVLAEEGHEVLVETRGDTGLARAPGRGMSSLPTCDCPAWAVWR